MPGDQLVCKKSFDKYKSWYKLDVEGEFITRGRSEQQLAKKRRTNLRKVPGKICVCHHPNSSRRENRVKVTSSETNTPQTPQTIDGRAVIAEYHCFEVKRSPRVVAAAVDLTVMLVGLVWLTALVALSFYVLRLGD